MSRVYLFSDFGKGPKAVGQVYRTKQTLGWFRLTETQEARRAAARRWWLVKCETAEAGRKIITWGNWQKNPACTFCDERGNYLIGGDGLCPCGHSLGRILDSGVNP